MALTITHQKEQAFGNCGSGTSQTLSAHTVGTGANRGLIVTVMWKNGNTRNITSVVWDPAGANQPMVEIVPGWEADNDAAAYAFYLENPTSGVNKDIQINFDGGLPNLGMLITAFSLEGMEQVSPIRDTDGFADSSLSTVNRTIITEPGDLVIGQTMFESASEGPVDWTGSSITMTELYNAHPGNNWFATAYGFATGVSTTVDVEWLNGSDQGAFQTFSVKPAPGWQAGIINGVTDLGSVNTVVVGDIGKINTV